MRSPWKAVPILVALVGGGCSLEEPAPLTPRVVDVSWAPNRETAVNAPRGGYRVEIGPLWGGPGALPPIDVPYVSGELAPTTVTTTLWSGTYRVSVRAYAATPDGAATTTSEPSHTIVRVP